MLDGLYRLQGLYLVAISDGQPVSLRDSLLCRLGIILPIPQGGRDMETGGSLIAPDSVRKLQTALNASE